MELLATTPGLLPAFSLAPSTPSASGYSSHLHDGGGGGRFGLGAGGESYTPLPTRSGRVPQLPEPGEADRHMTLFNEYLNYDWPSEDEEDDPDFKLPSDNGLLNFGGGGDGGGGGMDMFSNSNNDDDAEETDLSATEDSWMKEPSTSHQSIPRYSNFLTDQRSSNFDHPFPSTTATSTRSRTKSINNSKGKQKEIPTAQPTSTTKKRTRQPSPSPPPLAAEDSNSDDDLEDEEEDKNANSLEAPPKKKGRKAKYTPEEVAERRRARNRKAAAQSRLVKKELMKKEAGRLEELEKENQELKEKVLKLEAELEGIRNSRKGITTPGDGWDEGDEDEEEEEEELLEEVESGDESDVVSSEEDSSSEEANDESKIGNLEDVVPIPSANGLKELGQLLLWARQSGKDI